MQFTVNEKTIEKFEEGDIEQTRIDRTYLSRNSAKKRIKTLINESNFPENVEVSFSIIKHTF